MDALEDDIDLADPMNMAERLVMNNPRPELRNPVLGRIHNRLTGEADESLGPDEWEADPMDPTEFASSLNREQRERFVEGWGSKLLEEKAFTGTSDSAERRRMY